jgi:DNA-binding transcriptional regulator YhcF (GntR family)
MRPGPEQLDLRVDRAAELPLGTQLTWKLRALITGGALAAGDRLPSVRELAVQAGVNVNTVRAVYGRLETEGTIRSEQGRGTFVASPPRESMSGGERAARQELRRQIAALESELVRRAQPAPLAGSADESTRASGGRLPSTDELRSIRDRLFERLHELDDERADVLRRLAELDSPEPAALPQLEPVRRSSASLRGARVRWVGA